ncbi:unnamed protein product [[Candida] boidinii]|nr:unnamed protein product [[Candida] boidinii]
MKEQTTSPQSPSSSSFSPINESKDQLDEKIDKVLIDTQSSPYSAKTQQAQFVPLKEDQIPVNTETSVPELKPQLQKLASPIKTRNQSATHARSSSVQSNASSQRLHSYRTLSHIQQQPHRRSLEYSPSKVMVQPQTAQIEDVTSSTIEDEQEHAQ